MQRGSSVDLVSHTNATTPSVTMLPIVAQEREGKILALRVILRMLRGASLLDYSVDLLRILRIIPMVLEELPCSSWLQPFMVFGQSSLLV